MGQPAIPISLTRLDRRDLEDRIRNTPARSVADRLRMILYRADGVGHRAIAHRLQVGRNQVTKVLQRYQAGGLEAVLQSAPHAGARPKLTPDQQPALKVELTTHIYATAFQVIAWIDAQWQVVYELSAVQKLLKRLGFTQTQLVVFLAQLRAHHPGEGQIYLLLDNVAYNHAGLVTEAAHHHQIHLDYLPPYSPNLNPIERLWKFVRKAFFKDKYRATFAEFCSQLTAFFTNLDQYREDLNSLITLKFEWVPANWRISASN